MVTTSRGSLQINPREFVLKRGDVRDSSRPPRVKRTSFIQNNVYNSGCTVRYNVWNQTGRHPNLKKYCTLFSLICVEVTLEIM
jgi:hypothetical protein